MVGEGLEVTVLFRVPKDMPDDRFEELMSRLCDLSPALCDKLRADRVQMTQVVHEPVPQAG
jgi:hypothetical protein